MRAPFRPSGPLFLILVFCLLAAGVVWFWPTGKPARRGGSTASGPALSPPTSPPAASPGLLPPRNVVASEPAELRLARLIEKRREEPDPERGTPGREITLVASDFKYPLLRVEREMPPGQPARQRVMVGDHVLVRARPGTTVPQLNGSLARHGAMVRKQIPGTDLFLVALKKPGLEAYDRLLAGLSQERELLAYAEPDYVVHHFGLPNDPQFGQQWHLHNTGQSGGLVDADIDAPEAWDRTTGSSSVVVAVLDSGTDLNHPDLTPNLWVNPGESGDGRESDGIDNDSNGYIDDVHGWDFVSGTPAPMDDNGHGTHTAGTVGAAGDNGVGVSGVCQQVQLMPLKFLSASGSGTNSDAIEAIRYATAQNVLLTSNSWGGSGFSQAMLDAIHEANAAGIGFVAAAGNSGISNDLYPDYPANFNVPNMISVAATDHQDTLVWFSNFGAQTVHLAAAGLQTLSTGMGGAYEFMSGTSMAAPQVSGAAALLKAANSGLPFARIKSMLLGTTDSKPSLAGKTRTGGRLNVARALEPAMGPLLRFATLTVEDSLGGNGDGIASPGETVRLRVSVENLGAFEAASVQGVVSLPAPVSGFSLSTSVSQYGTINAGALQGPAGAPFQAQIAAGFTPRDVALTLTLTDQSARQWTLPLTLKVRNVATLSGLVTRLTGGAPVAGAVIEVTGPESYTALTGSDGRYSLIVTNGSYQIRASASGLVPSAAVTRSVPPSAANVNFVLGYSESDVVPLALSATQPQDDLTVQTLTLYNHGDAPMTYRLREVPGTSPSSQAMPAVAWTADAPAPTPPELARPSAHELPDLSRLRDASDNTAVSLPHQEGFEDGLWGRWWESWGEGTRQVITGGAPAGNRSFQFDFTGPNDHFTGIHQIFQGGTQPGHIGFWIQPGPTNEATAYMVLLDLYLVLDNNGFRTEIADFIWFFANANGRFYLNDDVGGNQAVQYQEGQWYRIEFRDIDWQAKRFDYWVNGQRIQAGVPFRNPSLASGLAYALSYNYSSGTRLGLDDLVVANDALPWLQLSSQQGIIPAGGSTSITVSFDSDRLAAGAYTGSLRVETNDPDSPDLEVPLSLAVSALPNTPPVAQGQTQRLPAGERRTLTLSGSDADGDNLVFRVTRLPERGTLYQTEDGVTPGDPLRHTPRVVLDAGHRLLYQPADGQSAEDYDRFEFVTADRWAVSAPASVSLSTAQAPQLMVLPEGGASASPVEVVLTTLPPEAMIHLTTDGSAPAPGHGHTVASGFTLRLERALTLRALARHDGVESPIQTQVYQIADENDNGLPDWWEAQHPQAAVAGTIDPEVDGDFDGLSNREEFLFGTDPVAPSVWQPEINPSGTPMLRWPSMRGRLYQVEKSATADPFDFEPEGSALWGTGGVMEWQDPNPSGGRGFYRLRVTAP